MTVANDLVIAGVWKSEADAIAAGATTNGLTITATTGTITVTNGTTITCPGVTATLAGLGVANSWSAAQTLADVDLVLGTTTGTKIGTATAQKLSFWGVAPVVQQVLATGTGKTADNILTMLQTLGLCKQT